VITFVLIGCTAILLALSGFVGDVAQVVARRAKAQLAADAAALGAVAESAPYGTSDPRTVAAGLAEANGARLVECECKPGDTTALVEVSVDGTRAWAKAVIDPALFGPDDVSEGSEGLHPAMKDAVARLLAATGGRVHVVSGFRSYEEQARLWADALARYGSPEAADDWVASPGHSMHERGLAVDLGGELELAARVAGELDLPLWRPLVNEPWHFELRVTRS
jgi:secretion/DNA translocation related TadE-like protein